MMNQVFYQTAGIFQEGICETVMVKIAKTSTNQRTNEKREETRKSDLRRLVLRAWPVVEVTGIRMAAARLACAQRPAHSLCEKEEGEV
jgi:hypothetical protein